MQTSVQICPYCGHESLQERQVELQEIDGDLMRFKPPEKLTELECKECGWFGTRPEPIR